MNEYCYKYFGNLSNVHVHAYSVSISLRLWYASLRIVPLKPNDAYMRHGLSSRERGSRGIPIMNVDVIVSKNFILALPSRAIHVPLTRKFTMNNIGHLNGQRTAQESRLQIKTGGSITV